MEGNLGKTERFIILAVLLFGVKSSWGLSDAQRLSQLNAAKRAIPSRVITLDFDSFEEYIESAPRSYSLFVMISADASMCQPCGAIRRHLEKLAKEYEQLPVKKKAPVPLFFADIKISSQDTQFLTSYGVRHVPILYFFKAGTTRSFPKIITDDSKDNYPLQQMGLTMGQMKEFLNSRSGSRFPIVRGGYQIPFVETVRAFMPLILITVCFSAVLAIITEAYKSPMLWFGLVVLVYIFSVGGGHYSWIHNTPLAVVNKDGLWEYIASGSRSQYVAEGFFVSATCVSISVLVILIQELPSVIPNKAGQTLLGSAMVFMTMCAIAALLVMYQFKMPGYLRYTEM